ncbi:hypothetical protein FOA52_008644 [Chlamydomonas sp. UWO 241]|nr:hypothetical protein FOA52_008644 [Chlamydomonas sp. UWO 241]
MSKVQGPRFVGIRTLGKGAYGFVQLANDQLYGEQVAIKYIPRGETVSFYKYVLREVLYHQQLSLCKHPHIVGFHEVFLTPRYLGVVMEFVDGQDLQAYLVKAGGRLSEDVARFVFQQLVVAVDFIHKKGKVNRDIKLANVLVVDSGQLPLVKLCDFGFSKDKFDDSAPQTQIGTALFTAPEVFLNVQTQIGTALFTAPEVFLNMQGHVYEGEAVDVWSCGVVLHMLLFGRHPFLSEDNMRMSQADQMVELIENMVKGRLQLPASAVLSPAADLLSRILVPSPKLRYGIADITTHQWFTAKLPPGALELNNAYLPAVGYQSARQTPDTIKQIIKSAIQVLGADGLPAQALPSASGGEWPDSPTGSTQRGGPQPSGSSAQQRGSAQAAQQEQAPAQGSSSGGGRAAVTMPI